MLQITTLYAGLLGALMVVLAVRVPIRRVAIEVAYGDGGDLPLATRIRAFGNFTEYVPMVLLLMALVELRGGAPAVLHGLGIALLGGRLVHCLVYRGKVTLNIAEKIGRTLGAATTVATLGSAAGYAIYLSLG